MTEPREIRLKRLHMRSIRRGIKEMDLILTAYATTHLPGLDDANLDLYEALLAENDHDIFSWINQQVPSPPAYEAMIAQVRTIAVGLTRPSAG